KALGDIVVPQEYGMTIEEKLSIARGIVTPLLRKIRAEAADSFSVDTVSKENIESS
ncbi:unnamed protein product, partial [Rotaria socialis]